MLALALLLLGGGGFFAYAGVTGQPVVPALRSVLSGQVPTSPGASSSSVEQTSSAGNTGGISARVAALIAAAPGKITVTSGTRTLAEQQKLWNAALAKYGSAAEARKWVAPPGTSMHEKGLANDLSFADAATQAWAHANAYLYGLVFPLGNEPWHVEVAGARPGTTLVGGEPIKTQPVVRTP